MDIYKCKNLIFFGTLKNGKIKKTDFYLGFIFFPAGGGNDSLFVIIKIKIRK